MRQLRWPSSTTGTFSAGRFQRKSTPLAAVVSSSSNCTCLSRAVRSIGCISSTTLPLAALLTSNRSSMSRLSR